MINRQYVSRTGQGYISVWESKRCEGLSKVIWSSPLNPGDLHRARCCWWSDIALRGIYAIVNLGIRVKASLLKQASVLLISIGGSEAVVATPRSAGGCQYCTQSAISRLATRSSYYFMYPRWLMSYVDFKFQFELCHLTWRSTCPDKMSRVK